jgi:signal transduction histidine kinase/AraC-like DNA-binding protein/ligand-binding sensor domain-containing protein/CheY-like chemotaxis protein
MYDGNNSYAKHTNLEQLVGHSSVTISQLYVTKKKQLFVATNKGLFLYDNRKAGFSLMTGGTVHFIIGDGDKLWILRDNQVDRFSISKRAVLRSYQLPTNNGNPIREYIMPHMSEVNGTLYITHGKDIFSGSEKGATLKQFATIPVADLLQIISEGNDLYVLSEKNGVYVIDRSGKVKARIDPNIDASAKQIYIDKNKILWIATQRGLYLYNLNTGKSDLKQYSPDFPNEIPHNSVWSIYPDPAGGVWIGTFGGKLAYTKLGEEEMNYVSPSTYGLNTPIVSCFIEDEEKNIWIGTEGGGISIWNRTRNTFAHFMHKNENSVLGSNLIKSFAYDHNNHLGIACYNDGIRTYDPEKHYFSDEKISYPPDFSKKINAYDLAFEADSGIWVIDSDISESLYYKNKRSGKVNYIPLEFGDGTVIHDRINCLYRAPNDYLYLFGTKGLYKFDVRKRKVEQKYTTGDPLGNGNYLTCFSVGKDNTIWIGTRNNGILRFKENEGLTKLKPERGEIPTIVFSINLDASTNTLWFTGTEGLFYYSNLENRAFKYNKFDQKKIGAFYPKAMYQVSSGEIYIGGTNGFIYFSPKELLNRVVAHHIYFTRFLINNQIVSSLNKDSPLKYDISCFNSTDEPIKLNYKQANITIEFSNTDYSEASHDEQYYYRLTNGSNNWMPLDIGQRIIQFFNLPAGHYTFEIAIAGKLPDQYQPLSSLQFSISPAPWASLWAKSAYILFALAIVFFLWRYYTEKELLKQKLEVEKMKEQELVAINKLRTAFFTRITHDLKTPLTLILNPIKELKEIMGTDGLYRYYVDLIENNSLKIQHKISQLLKLRQIESDNLILHSKVGDIAEHLERSFKPFAHYAHKNAVQTAVSYPMGKLPLANYDHEILDQIYTNLFSNAVKYTPAAGFIEVEASLLEKVGESIKSKTGTLILKVSNSGVSLEERDKEFIFNAFNKVGVHNSAFEERTGLGLSIVKELVRRLTGTILVDLNEDILSFIVYIPLEIINDMPSAVSDQDLISVHTPITIKDEEDSLNSSRKFNKHTIVLIEDNKVLNKYICLELKKRFNVYGALDGKSGLAHIKKYSPTLIITDIDLPDISGYEICRTLRTDLETSHIPIVMLSGMEGNDEVKIEGLSSGADAFIGKPFQLKFLLQQIDNLIQGREKLKELYGQRYIIDPRKISISSLDDELIARVVKTIDENLGEAEFDVESLVSKIGMSRTLLYRKVNNFTGMGVKELILDLRLKRAKQLLEESSYSISEIAYESGFNDPKYFSVCFKKHFGVSPSEFKKQ